MFGFSDCTMLPLQLTYAAKCFAALELPRCCIVCNMKCIVHTNLMIEGGAYRSDAQIEDGTKTQEQLRRQRKFHERAFIPIYVDSEDNMLPLIVQFGLELES